jgi:hypothetical protein
MKKEYLPSKEFIVRIVIIAAVVGLVFGIYKITTYIRNHSSKKSLTPLVIKDIVQKDSNANGIPDWEETLWSLDPTKDGPSNKEFIEAKQATLAAQNKEAGLPDASDPATENEALAREFFAVIMSLEQTGNLDESSMAAVSEAIGKKIVTEPIADLYRKETVKVTEDDPLETIKYYTAYLNLNIKYKDRDMGNELSFIATALEKNDPQALAAVKTIATAYRSFAKDLIKISVPSPFVAIHLSMANNYEKTAQSIEDFTKILSEPLVGMKALINYKKYSDAIALDIEHLSDNFK